ncbi:MAG: helix-turn-helix domain-containing protein, partial [Candidatus Moranbacteria bacterium]|nr:helix-turn-helix domain-containing protein [Candidatus Moranbacteria bacterium]
MEHLIEPLKNLGLTDKEARIYLALLQVGPATPYQIAKKAQIKRPTAYVIAEELVEKGLIVHIPGESPRRYIARTPDSFFEDAENKLSQAKHILPELRSLQKGVEEKPSILYFEGVNGIELALMHRVKELHNTEVVGFYADAALVSPSLLGTTEAYNQYRVRHHITSRGIVTDTEELR